MNNVLVHILWDHVKPLDTSCLKDTLRIESNSENDIILRKGKNNRGSGAITENLVNCVRDDKFAFSTDQIG